MPRVVRSPGGGSRNATRAGEPAARDSDPLASGAAVVRERVHAFDFDGDGDVDLDDALALVGGA